MKNLRYVIIVCAGAMLMLSCNKQIQEKQANPNNPESVPAQLILGTVLTDISGTGTAGSLGGINSWGTVHNWNQYHCQNYDYYGNNI